jgi:hypothetical protein
MALIVCYVARMNVSCRVDSCNGNITVLTIESVDAALHDQQRCFPAAAPVDSTCPAAVCSGSSL